MSEQTILATIDGVQITEESVDAFIANLPKEQRRYAGNPLFRKQCLEQIISVHLYAKMAEDEKLDETDEFKQIMESARKDILAQFAMNKVMQSAAVSEDECQAFYSANPQNFQKEETVRAKHILVNEEETCKEILTAIQNGEKEFEAAAEEYSTCPSGQQGGDLGTFGRGQMVAEFEQAAFDAEIGQVIGPVKTQFGYHLIQVTEKNEAAVIPYEEVAAQIKEELLRQKQNEVYAAKVQELRGKYMGE